MQLFQRPLLQPLIVCRATDPLSGLLVEEEWNAATIAFVIFSHQFGIDLIMPDLKLRHLNPLLILQSLHERIHLMAVGSLGAGEF